MESIAWGFELDAQFAHVVDMWEINTVNIANDQRTSVA